MKRRALLAAAAGAAAWPLAGHTQQAERIRRVGVLVPFRENDPFAQAIKTAFAQALGRFGWIEGQNIRIDYRLAAGDSTLINTYAAQLVELSPDVILASTTPAVAALQEQTHTIPIVFALLVDPVGLGLVQSLARPGGDITGFTSYDPPILAKWLQLLKEIAPHLTHVAVIFNPDTVPEAPFVNRAIEAAAPSLGITVTLTPVHDDAEIEEAIASQEREPGGGLITLPNAFNIAHRDVIVAAATRHRLPLIGDSEFPRSGALMS